MAPVSDEQDIARRLDALRAQIQSALAAAGRPAGAARLVAVSKTQPEAQVAAALDAGQIVFGENRVQEAEARWAARRAARNDIELRLIGPLQTNKAANAVDLFDAIETLDRPKLARELARLAAAGARMPKLLVQVNIGEEPQKAGVALAELAPLLDLCADLGLSVDGLMCLPPAGQPPAPFFALLSKLADRHRLAQRSMGMSADFACAIAHGATSVRIGEGVFGPRAPSAQRQGG